MTAEGWYQDPYRMHGERWFSNGRPTELVRDGRVESHHQPPDRPWPTPLMELPHHADPVRRRRTSWRSRLGLERHIWFWVIYAPTMAVCSWQSVADHRGRLGVADAVTYSAVSVVFLGRVALAVARTLRPTHSPEQRASHP